MEKILNNQLAIVFLWVSFFLTRSVGVVSGMMGSYDETRWLFVLVYGVLGPLMWSYVWLTTWQVGRKHEPEVRIDWYVGLIVLQFGLGAVMYLLQPALENWGLQDSVLTTGPAYLMSAMGIAGIIGIWASPLRLFGMKSALAFLVFTQFMAGLAFQGLFRLISPSSWWITAYSSAATILGIVVLIIHTIVFVRANQADRTPNFRAPNDVLIDEIGQDDF